MPSAAAREASMGVENATIEARLAYAFEQAIQARRMP